MEPGIAMAERPAEIAVAAPPRATERAPKVAILHQWLVTMRGGERLLEAICDIFPSADIFTHVAIPERLSPVLRRRTIHTSFIQRLPFAGRLYQRYLPLMPLALEGFDLQDFDLVVSSDSGPVKGALTHADALHICYCHTPMRYVWGMEGQYTARSSWLVRRAFPLITHYMRLWDFAAAGRVDEFVANSATVAARIRKFYRRDSTVIWPPVACDDFAPAAEKDDFYLCAGQLVPYKRVDLAIEACNRLGRNLVVIGEGGELARLRRMAGPTVKVIGAQPFAALREHYARCRALLFPGEEDFGIVPVEAMASGTPVIALRRGGALDTVADGRTGLFFDAQTPEGLSAAILEFEARESSFDPAEIVAHARQFDRAQFERRFRAFVDRCLTERGRAPLPV